MKTATKTSHLIWSDRFVPDSEKWATAHAEAKAHVAAICAGHLYTAGKGRGYNLYITKGTLSLGRAGELAFKGIDKRTARKLCKEHGAVPHNF